MSEIDWTAIRTDYENGLSLRQLAGKYNVSKTTIGERKYKEQWQRAQSDNRTDNANTGYITRDVNAAVRVHSALKLYLEERPTWETIAARTGYGSRTAAWIAVQREIHRCITEDIKELQAEDLYMLQQVQARCYKAATDEKNKDWTWAVDRFISVSERKAKLMGMDTPVDQAINNNFTVVREVPMNWIAPVEAQPT